MANSSLRSSLDQHALVDQFLDGLKKTLHQELDDGNHIAWGGSQATDKHAGGRWLKVAATTPKCIHIVVHSTEEAAMQMIDHLPKVHQTS